MTCIRSSEHGSVKPRSRAPTRELHSNKSSVSQTRTSVRNTCEAEIQEEYARQHEMQRVTHANAWMTRNTLFSLSHATSVHECANSPYHWNRDRSRMSDMRTVHHNCVSHCRLNTSTANTGIAFSQRIRHFTSVLSITQLRHSQRIRHFASALLVIRE